jgi:hypothetical protein
MKPPFKVVVDKHGNRGIYNGAAILEFQSDDTVGKKDPVTGVEFNKQFDDRCTFYNAAWEHGFIKGVESAKEKL